MSRKLFLLPTALVLVAFFFFLPQVQAKESNNITGVNLACRWSPQDPSKIQNLVGTGGWVVIMATPGDGVLLQQFFDQIDSANGINVLIRLDKMKQSYTPADARAWVAMLASLDTDQRIYVMPWNEPNQEVWPRPGCKQEDTSRSCAGRPKYIENTDLDDRSLSVVAERVNTYTQEFLDAINESGMSQKIFLLSPMINQTHPNYDHFIQLLGGGDFYNKFDGVALNLYDGRVTRSAGPLKKPEPYYNAARYRQLLNNLGVNPNKPVFAVEAGLSIDGDPLGVRYEDRLIHETISAAAENNPIQEWVNDGNFDMFAVFSYDPEHEEDWDIFSSSLTRGYFQDLSDRLGGRVVTTGNPSTDAWVTDQLNQGTITACQDGISYAASESLCASVCGAGGVVEPLTRIPLSYGTAKGDVIRQEETVERNRIGIPPITVPVDTSKTVDDTIKPTNDRLNIPDLGHVFDTMAKAERLLLLPMFADDLEKNKEIFDKLYPARSETATIAVEYPLCSLTPRIGDTEVQATGRVTAPTQDGYLQFIARARVWCGILGTCNPAVIDKNNPREIELPVDQLPEDQITPLCYRAQGVNTASFGQNSAGTGSLTGQLMVPACFDPDQDVVDFALANQPLTFYPGSLEAANYFYRPSWKSDQAVSNTDNDARKSAGLVNFWRPPSIRLPELNIPLESNAITLSPHDLSVAGSTQRVDVNLEWHALGGIYTAHQIWQCLLSTKEIQDQFDMDCQTLPEDPPACGASKPIIRDDECSGNLLQNPDFEAGFSERGRGEIVVANGWNPWWIEGTPDPDNSDTWGFNYIPEFKPEDASRTTNCRIAHGTKAQKFFTSFATHTAGMFQQVTGVTPGENYTFSIIVQTWSSDNDDPSISNPPGNYQTTVGIDPTGGTDPQADGVVWAEPVVFHDDWVRLEVSAAAQSTSITVFARGAPEFKVKHNDSYWDWACLTPSQDYCGVGL